MPFKQQPQRQESPARGVYIEPSYPWERMYGFYDSSGKRRGEFRIPIEDDSPEVLESCYTYLDKIDSPLKLID